MLEARSRGNKRRLKAAGKEELLLLLLSRDCTQYGTVQAREGKADEELLGCLLLGTEAAPATAL